MAKNTIHIQNLLASDRMGSEIFLFHDTGEVTVIDVRHLALIVDDKEKIVTLKFSKSTAMHAKNGICTIKGPEGELKNFAHKWLKLQNVPS